MPAFSDIVITGMGVVCPIGVGCDQVRQSLLTGRSGVRLIPELADAGYPIAIGGDVPQFDPKEWVKPRKALKVMSREMQLGFAAGEMAWAQAGLDVTRIDPDRIGVTCGSNMYCPDVTEFATACRACVSGEEAFDFAKWGPAALPEIFPLWMLKYLPNMTPAHLSIAHDARGPSNSLVAGDTSGLLAIIEAADVLARGHADVMLAGGASSNLSVMDLSWHGGARLSRRVDDPAAASRPFDVHRDGMVNAEGAAIFVMERGDHAAARGARPIARLISYARTNEAAARTQEPTGQAIRQALRQATAASPNHAAPGHVSAMGMALPLEDRIEAQAIAAELPLALTTAPKSLIGHCGAACGAVELAINLAAAVDGFVPPTLNLERLDPECPIRPVTAPEQLPSPRLALLSHRSTGQAVTLIVEAVD